MFASNTSQVSNEALFVEDVMSCTLYTGNGSTQTISNGIDLAGKGGLVWIKSRTSAASHSIWDTARTPYYYLSSNTTTQEQSVSSSNALTAYNSDGFTVSGGSNSWNGSQNYVSWTFRKQPKFFDVVTYTGNGVYQRQLNHSLGSSPGVVLIKRTDSTGNWVYCHKGTYALRLNSTAAANTTTNGYASWTFGSTASATYVELLDGDNANDVNLNGATYVAYFFASDAGGFGLTGTDNVISCGSFTGSTTVSLGYEPQWLLVKNITSAQDWRLYDTMRGFDVDGNVALLRPNLSNAEVATSGAKINSTGFYYSGGSDDYIYIAIRRGPMKVPTSGTSVFSPQTWTGNDTAGRNIATGFPVDLTVEQIRTNSSGVQSNLWFDRLRGYSSTAAGNSYYLRSQTTDAESYVDNYNYVPTMDGFNFGSVASGGQQFNSTNGTAVGWNFRRAPSFFDEVCYTGTGSATTFSHNLGVAPELMIVKNRSSAGYGWLTYSATLGATKYLQVNSTAAEGTVSTYWNNTSPTSSVFSVGTAGATNASGGTYVAYLFATCAGVSKCTAFTGTGTLQTIDCGFTGGARFVLIKRTDSTGDWYVWDSSRGLSSSTDPYLLLNSTAAEVTSTNWVDTTSTGFQVTAASGNNVNINGASYIALAIS